jgi:hypothetical protein
MFFELLEELYEHITCFRRKGVKMKDIAHHVHLSPSIVSALYSTVLPAYLNNRNSLGQEEALDYAMSQVNNISKKRIKTLIPDMCLQLRSFTQNQELVAKGITFINTLNKFTGKSDEYPFSFFGVYDSFSLSSTGDALKIEPFVLSSGEAGEIQVVRRNAYNIINTGIAIVANGHSMYIMLNESDKSQLALVTIYLQLPFQEKATFLRGLYMALDNNRNPIARRILFVKRNDLPDDFDTDSLKGDFIQKEKLNPQLYMYYEYFSDPSDIIKMCSIPFPKFNQEDLISEKKILSTIIQPINNGCSSENYEFS